VGFVVNKMALGKIFTQYFLFPNQFLFQRLLHIHHLSFGAGTIGQLVADVPSGFRVIPLQETKKKKNYIYAILPIPNVNYFYYKIHTLISIISKTTDYR
jgi:hypothetical protein